MTAVALPLLLGAATLGMLWLLKLRGHTLALAVGALVAGGALFMVLASTENSRPDLTDRAPPRSLAAARQAFTGRFSPTENWLVMSDALASRGNTQDAAGLLIAAVRQHPGDYSLWIGLGNALVDHSNGLTSPARFAFDRAQQLAPGHPAPAFFLGLAEARSGHRNEAVRLWKEILARAPADASWRPMVEDAVLATGGS